MALSAAGAATLAALKEMTESEWNLWAVLCEESRQWLNHADYVHSYLDPEVGDDIVDLALEQVDRLHERMDVLVALVELRRNGTIH